MTRKGKYEYVNIIFLPIILSILLVTSILPNNIIYGQELPKTTEPFLTCKPGYNSLADNHCAPPFAQPIDNCTEADTLMHGGLCPLKGEIAPISGCRNIGGQDYVLYPPNPPANAQPTPNPQPKGDCFRQDLCTGEGQDVKCSLNPPEPEPEPEPPVDCEQLQMDINRLNNEINRKVAEKGKSEEAIAILTVQIQVNTANVAAQKALIQVIDKTVPGFESLFKAEKEKLANLIDEGKQLKKDLGEHKKNIAKLTSDINKLEREKKALEREFNEECR